MVEEREIKIHTPASLMEVNLASYMVFAKVMKVEGLSDVEKVVQIIAALNNLDVEDVRQIPITDLDKIGGTILDLFTNHEIPATLDEYRILTIDDISYGLEPNFDKLETGAYIDITDNILPDLEVKMAELMAVLYRPITDVQGDKYSISKYSTEEQESVEARQKLFLSGMPYGVVRVVVNFMLSRIES